VASTAFILLSVPLTSRGSLYQFLSLLNLCLSTFYATTLWSIPTLLYTWIATLNPKNAEIRAIALTLIPCLGDMRGAALSLLIEKSLLEELWME